MQWDVKEGVRNNGEKGATLTRRHYVKSGMEREPSGHVFEQVSVRLESWFHPYTGKPPRRIA